MKHIIKMIFISVVVLGFSYADTGKLVDVKYAQGQIEDYQKKIEEDKAEIEKLKTENSKLQNQIKTDTEKKEEGMALLKRMQESAQALNYQISVNKDLDTRVKLKNEYDALYNNIEKVRQKIYVLFNNIETSKFVLKKNRKRIYKLKDQINTSENIIQNFKTQIENSKSFGNNVDDEVAKAKNLQSEAGSFIGSAGSSAK